MRVVEGVGYDGHLGDLLTPLRAPLAGYGYSIGSFQYLEDADGSLLYKGCGYNNGGYGAADFDRSGMVDIDDLNLCINRVLMPESVDVRCDVTGDGRVDIDDVNIVINRILAP